MGMDVEHAGVGERTIVSGPAVGGEAQMIGCSGFTMPE
jgi:hypothetical protein